MTLPFPTNTKLVKYSEQVPKRTHNNKNYDWAIRYPNIKN